MMLLSNLNWMKSEIWRLLPLNDVLEFWISWNLKISEKTTAKNAHFCEKFDFACCLLRRRSAHCGIEKKSTFLMKCTFLMKERICLLLVAAKKCSFRKRKSAPLGLYVWFWSAKSGFAGDSVIPIGDSVIVLLNEVFECFREYKNRENFDAIASLLRIVDQSECRRERATRKRK